MAQMSSITCLSNSIRLLFFSQQFLFILGLPKCLYAYAQVATNEDFIATFTFSVFGKLRFPFAPHPIVTDVTYNAVSGNKKYLCLSVVYVLEMQKSIVFFQAIIGGLAAKNITDYFIQLFQQMNISKHIILGMIMDFSAAQRLGFIHAYNYYFNNSANGTGSPEQMMEALSHLKGCFVHWMQSVQRLVKKTHSVVPPELRQEFLQLHHGAFGLPLA